MKNFKHVAIAFSLLIGVLFFKSGQAVAQNDVLSSVKSAIKIGSSKDLSRHFDSKVSISFADGNSTDYSNTQAEFVMKNFFSKTGPTDFTYTFDGSSDKGKRYAIGSYSSRSGSFTVLVRLKEAKGRYMIHSMDFIED